MVHHPTPTKRQRRRTSKRVGTLLLLSLAVGFTGPGLTWSDSLPLDETVRQDISLAHTTQKREGAWEKERRALETKISRLESTQRSLQEEVDALLWANGRKEKEAARLDGEIAKASHLTEGLSPLIADEAKRATQVVTQSLPFLKNERETRLAALTDWVKAPATKQAEKLERLLELFTIETQFGHTSEAWQEEIEVEGEPITVQLLKVGRLSLYYLTLDEKGCGVFSPEKGAYEPLPANCAPHLKKAIALAQRERSAELVSLPIGRIVTP
ncbi:DUF3450 domain-containing protein [Desulfoluna butyratoxydans]|uniref:Uncharacterized conserved protein ucp028069 n=1 Tax=Desulfoluna butyratoxydans TaxID=231438 RepID=A0A4U8YS20_9BACT|nr:DUF3450 domain-containing protein [Desulfoluna butyratoxydans]VFQ46287.1 uncharacterised conserved protein ucp028069 [Desulfoluna butyratoxydans]